jgi:hypothetical protein
MDLVYICRDGENEELRYSIRSAVKNLPHSKIWVVGGKPEWYGGNFIPVKQASSKYSNVRNILEEIKNNNLISNKFILMNDDFFVLKPVKRMKNFHGGSLRSKVELHQDLAMRSAYTSLLQQTYMKLIRMGIKDPLDYDIHVPMIMSRSGLGQAIKGGGLWRSSYGNIFAVGGKKIDDVKVYDGGPLKSKSYDFTSLRHDFMSTDDSSFELVKDSLLAEMFSEPTIYELDFKNSIE